MPRKSFAYNLERSKIALLPSGGSESKIIPRAMAQVVFNAVNFEFEGERHKPYMVFEGEIEAYSIMKNSDYDFFCKVKRVVFAPDNRPIGIWRYDFDDNQLADIAAAEWFSYGSNTPSEFLSGRFALIVDNIQVDILNPNKKKAEAPILKAGPADNHMYTFNSKDYELSSFIIKNVCLPQTQFETILDNELEERNVSAREAMTQRKEAAIQEPVSLTQQQINIRNAVVDAELYTKAIWDEIDAHRAANNKQYYAEMKALKAGRSAETAASSMLTADAKPQNETKQSGVDASSKLDDFLSMFNTSQN